MPFPTLNKDDEAGTATTRSRRTLLQKLRVAASAKATVGPTAARSQDFLYDEAGLPRSDGNNTA
ncbi:MAG: hypothetical protein CMO30_28715 [Tistrella sp.]|jgi:hypothetical protein|uniref:Uncharacterized protein n=1 Tax=Tistrella mobilis TaxID=171437 RepID=A0A3B9IIC0_9PROT|nr:hypothetical protein [Tistrella sp.]MBA79258.1 hypothetical protein [Tistrella sp.]HAE47545.1 hypothetical protein [Tistrella mobilis]